MKVDEIFVYFNLILNKADRTKNQESNSGVRTQTTELKCVGAS
jgi:hypothetical protein